MPDWQERITRGTPPAIRAEHELRYRIVAPLIAESAVWADLGCGTGLAALAALDGRRPERAVLVDIEPDVVDGAAHELGIPDTSQLAGDLTNRDLLDRIGEALLNSQGRRIVSCFEVVEHLTTFIPLLEWSGLLARDHVATFVISVPNDAFWSIENPYHATSWSEGAFEELRLLLPDEHTLLRQVSLTGSALVDWEATPERLNLAPQIGGESAVATHFIAAFGPRHHEMQHLALAAQTDMLGQRRWERQRESNLALAEALLREQSAQFTEWRAYIHELERELGWPLSGTADELQADSAGSAAASLSAEHRPESTESDT